MESFTNFVEWGSDWIKVGDKVPYRYAIVIAKYGTGLQWVKYNPYSSGKTLEYSHGNFYGDTFEKALNACKLAIAKLIELDQTGYWFDIWNRDNPVKKKSW